jgi:glutamate--cysteine ligase
MLSLAEMAAQFQPDPNQEYRVLVGFEYEVMLFKRETFKPLGYDGERGLGTILQRTAQMLSGTVIDGSPPNKVALPDGAQISLEPGGQFEYSSAPTPNFMDCVEQLESFLSLIDSLCEEFKLHAFYGGANPLHTLDEIGLVIPNSRYRIMNDYFPRVGQLGRRMMRQTTSIQVTFDFRTAELGAELFRAALYVAPLAAALFANSPFIDGRKTNYRSYRGRVWRNTDPSRCGLPPGFTRPDYSAEDYVSHINKAPMFFVNTKDGIVDAEGMSFERFNEHGFGGQQATIDDFNLHASTIFTDARLKRTVELRSVDGQDPALMPAVLAFLSGLLLCNSKRPETLGLLSALDVPDYDGLCQRLAREGLSGEVAGRPTRELMAELVASAKGGVATCYPDGPEAVRYLDPLSELVEDGRTPADVVCERFKTPEAWLKAGRTF